MPILSIREILRKKELRYQNVKRPMPLKSLTLKAIKYHPKKKNIFLLIVEGKDLK
jgi:hypothetical protein